MAEGMKPFDLEKALAGEPVVTRDGRKVQQFKHFHSLTDRANRTECIGAVLDGSVREWNLKGEYRSNYLEDTSKYDLFMAPKQRTAWVNVYKQESGSLIAAAVPYTSEQAAKDAAAKSTMRLVQILPVAYEE